MGYQDSGLYRWSARLFAAGGLAASVLGCTSLPYDEPEFHSPKDDPDFPGILSSLDDSNSVDVLTIHGMCTHTYSEWVVGTNRRLTEVLGAKIEKSDNGEDGDNREESDGGEFVEKPVVSHDGVELYTFTLRTEDGKRINHHAILWSGATTEAKESLCYDMQPSNAEDSELCEVGRDGDNSPSQTRAKWNSNSKDALMNDCLADAVIYSGAHHERIRDAVANVVTVALAWDDELAKKRSRMSLTPHSQEILAKSVEKDWPIYFISESMGSKVLFDALQHLRRSSDIGERAIIKTRAGSQVVFMGSNQLPILGLAGNQSASSLLDYAEVHTKAESTLGVNTDNIKPLTIVGFTDPNDALSYGLIGSEYSKNPELVIYDVFVSNTETWFGMVADPLAAHMGYRENEDVYRLIACGRSLTERADSRCRW